MSWHAEWEERQALREDVLARVVWLLRSRHLDRNDHLWLAYEHIRLATDPNGANREHHLLYACRHLLSILEAGCAR